MASFPAAEARLFKNVWVCMACNAKKRASDGKVPDSCRKCGAKCFRQKNRKVKKTS